MRVRPEGFVLVGPVGPERLGVRDVLVLVMVVVLVTVGIVVVDVVDVGAPFEPIVASRSPEPGAAAICRGYGSQRRRVHANEGGTHRGHPRGPAALA